MNRVAVPLELSPPAARPRGGAMIELGGPTMGVAWSAKALAPPRFDAAGAQAGIQALLNRLVAQMSPWEPQSDISRFNQAPAGAWLNMAPAFQHVLTGALAWAQASEGAFDPTAGRLVDLWGFGPPGAVEAPPAPADIAAALGARGWDRLALEGSRVFQPGGLALDFSGIAKGFGVDEVSRALNLLGLPDHLVEIGGELRGQGVKPDGEPWWVEIAAPPGARLPGGPILLALHGLSIATSGDYHRFLDHGGRRYAHTLDPRFGRPIDNGVRSVSVIHRTCMDADALSTALGVLGALDGPQFAVKHGLAAYFLVDDGDGLREILSPKFEAMLG
ncbi:MAG: FAD:protein FMN transferase [Phenylobacterium sp.]|uniref:FAD:protein FMN transferase n=1 Tax=Phenylobacterium sp. TaxID=1871053 RepID=UPI00271D8B2D|nr:FAD:protein FMN transferase [Phenylobacterium sp.]MDO9432512.1 FAD:protein FMN transferase [Phenylobacterium sp.]